MNYRNEARELVLQIGITPNGKGYQYIIDAICLLTINIRTRTLKLYSEVAKTHGDTPQKVERAIRHTITQLFSKPNALDDIKKIFGLTVRDEKLTNSEFLWLCADYILNV